MFDAVISINPAGKMEFFSAAALMGVPRPRRKKGAAPTNTTDLDSTGRFGRDVYGWGDNDLFPNQLKKIVNSNATLQSALRNKSSQLLAGGIATGRKIKGVFSPDDFPEWDSWARKSLFDVNYSPLATRNLGDYFIAFISVVLSEDGTEITLVKTIPAPNCRLSLPDAKTGISEQCYVSSYWEKGVTTDDTTKVIALPVIPTWYHPAEQLRKLVAKNTSAREYVYVIRIPTDQSVYPMPDYYSVIQQGWVDVSNDVPQFKRWLMKNLAHVNYMLFIADFYWPKRFPEWNAKAKSGKPADLQQLRDWRSETILEISNVLSGVQNAGKMLISDVMVIDQLARTIKDPELLKAIRLEVIDNVKFDGKYLQDSQEADTQIIRAVGVDPSSFGTAPGEARQGGSDKRESHNISQVTSLEAELVLLQIPYFVADFNRMPVTLEFKISRSTLQTVDKITPSQRDTGPATIPKP